MVDQQEVFCLGITAPIANLFLQVKMSDKLSFGDKVYQINKIY